jgi:hemerythrin-like metal-binding protein
MHTADWDSAGPADTIDTEHRVQLGLLRALCDGVEKGLDCLKLREIVEQLAAYSDVNFLSELLLMRLYGYPAYEAHALEHDRMMEALQDLEADVGRGADSVSAERAEELRQMLLEHIRSHDREFAAFMGEIGEAGCA